MQPQPQRPLSEIISTRPTSSPPLADIFGVSQMPRPVQELRAEKQGFSLPNMQQVGSGLSSVFGGGVIGSAIGTSIGKRQWEKSPGAQELQQSDPESFTQIQEGFQQPTARQLAGDVAYAASTFIPVGRLASLASKGLLKLGVGSKLLAKGGAKVAGKVLAGAGTGAVVDTSIQATETGDLTPTTGLATGIGAGLPLVGPAIRGVGRLMGESAGVTTGAGYGAIREAFESVAQGGKRKEAFYDALRKNTTPEDLVRDTRNNLGLLKSQRSDEYVQQLSKISDNPLPNTERIQATFNKQLQNFNVVLNEAGELDFSRSAIRFDNEAQNTIRKIYGELQTFGQKPGDRTVLGLDLLKQSFDDLYSDSSRVRGFTRAMSQEAKSIASQQPGYADMLKKYETSTRFINEVEKALSVGDKTQVDTAFRKLSGALRVNNEFRRQLLDELDQVSDNAITAQISGQQLSELLPRGIMRAIAGGGAIAGVASGGVMAIPAVLKAALTTSPRVIGEFVGALGLGAQKSRIMRETLEELAGAGGLQTIKDFGTIQAQRLPAQSSESEE
jgi:hypothetical protein